MISILTPMPEITLDVYSGPLPAFSRTIGPRNAKIALVGEALGETEDTMCAPFMGASGQELTRMLSEAGLRRAECFLTNTFSFRPRRNDIESLCVPKAGTGVAYPMPPLRQGKYFHPKLLPELERLKHELEAVRPNLVLALGNTACWALLSRSAISSIRGTVAASVLVPGVKVLPTYHPAAVLRNWALRPIVIADLLKAERESHFAEIVRPERQILVNPDLAQIREWFDRPAKLYAVDIETSGNQITMIGFARSPSDALVIPFVDLSKPTGSYWDSPQAERQAWELVELGLSSAVPKVFQNGLYDLQFLAKMGFQPRCLDHDTMLFHHALFPELQKGLGFMGSIYTNESSWKLMARHDGNKRDE